MVYVPPIKRKRKHGPTVGITGGIKLLTNNSSTMISQKPFVEPASDPYVLLEASNSESKNPKIGILF